MTCEPRPNTHVGVQDYTMNRLEMRTVRLHLSSRMSNYRVHGTIVLKRMSRCRSGACRLLSVSLWPILASLAHRRAITVSKHRRFNKEREEDWHDVSGNAGCLFSGTPSAPWLCAEVRHDSPVPRCTTASAVDLAAFFQLGFLVDGFDVVHLIKLPSRSRS